MALPKHRRFSRLLVPFSRFAIRFHLSLILLGTLASGWISAKLLLLTGMSYMPIRYFLSTLCAYGIFILLSSLWLKYLGRHSTVASRRANRNNLNYMDAPMDLPDISAPHSMNTPGEWGEGGGGFSGAGASGTFAEGMNEWQIDSSRPSLPDLPDASLDVDDIFGAIVAFIFVVVVFFLLTWSAYLLIQLPILLAEGLFQAILTAALIRTTKKMDNHNWAESVFKQTRWIAACILVITLTCGFVAEIKCPSAQKLADAFTCRD